MYRSVFCHRLVAEAGFLLLASCFSVNALEGKQEASGKQYYKLIFNP